MKEGSDAFARLMSFWRIFVAIPAVCDSSSLRAAQKAKNLATDASVSECPLQSSAAEDVVSERVFRKAHSSRSLMGRKLEC